jgi:hypothetical protein
MIYPDDVLPVIDGWLADYPDARNRLTELLRDNADLAKATETPLLCAMMCLLAEAGTGPATAEELTGRTMTRLLEGSWRGTGLPPPDRDAARAAARELAWAGARSDPATSLAAWPRAIQHTFRPALSEQLDRAISHVASALPYDPDQTSVAREFLHPSFREYLVAEHVATLPLDQAAQVIEPHLWYDPQWRPVLPRAIAAHPDHGALLDAVIRGQAGTLDRPAALDLRDGFGELRGLLLNLAAETSPVQWPQPLAELIDRECQSERAAGRQGREALMAAGGRGWPAAQLSASELADLVTTEKWMSPSAIRATAGAVQLSGADRQRLIAGLLTILAPQGRWGSPSWEAERAAILLDAIAPPRDAARVTAAAALAEQLRTEADPYLARALRLVSDAPATPVLLRAILEQIPSRPGDSFFHSTAVTDVEIRSLVLTLDELGADTGTRREAMTRILAYLAAAPARTSEKRKSGEKETEEVAAAEDLADAIVQLRPTAQERGQAIAALFGRLSRVSSSYAIDLLMRSLEALSPSAEQAGAVLTELVRHGPWNRSSEAGQLLGRLAAACAHSDRAAAIAAVSRHFADAPILDLCLWALHLTVLAPLPAEREAAAEALTARLSETPVNACGDLMIAARELQPNVSQRHRLLTYLLQGIKPEVEPGLRLALCEMASWFSPDGSIRDAIAGAVLDHADSEPIAWNSAWNTLRYYDAVLSAGLFTSPERERLLAGLLAQLPAAPLYQADRITRMIAKADPSAQLREDMAAALLSRIHEGADDDNLGPFLMILHELQPAGDWRTPVKDHMVARLAAGIPAAMAELPWRTLLQGLPMSDADRDSLARAVAENLNSRMAFDEDHAFAQLDAIRATRHQETAVAALMVERMRRTSTSHAARIGAVLSLRTLDADLRRTVVDILAAHFASAESGHLGPLLNALGNYPLSGAQRARIGAIAIDRLESIDVSHEALKEIIEALLATCGPGNAANSRRAIDVIFGHVAQGGRVDAQLADQMTQLGFDADELVRFTARHSANVDLAPQLRDLASLARRNCDLASWLTTLDRLAECRPGRVQPPDGPIPDQLS